MVNPRYTSEFALWHANGISFPCQKRQMGALESITAGGGGVRNSLQERQLLAQIGFAACGVAAAGLGEHGHATHASEPCGEGDEGAVDVVRYALGVSAGVVVVQIFF